MGCFVKNPLQPSVSTLKWFLCLSGEIVPNVTVHILEGNVTVTWDYPQENPGDYLYQVQLSK